MALSKVEFAVKIKSEECINVISECLANLKGIRNFDISLDRCTVIVESDLPYSIIQEKLEKTGTQAVLKGYGDGLSGVATFGGGGSSYCVNKMIKGVVRFAEIKDENGCLIDGTIDGLSPGEHGMHIHEYGDITKGCDSVGEHFNPNNSLHGDPKDDLSKRHLGDIGNISVDPIGRATFLKVDKFLKISDIIGRSLVITQDPDDLGKGDSPKSKIDGNSGTKLACSVIARSSGLYQNTKKICVCNGVTIWEERDQACKKH